MASTVCPAPVPSGKVQFGDVETTIGGLEHGVGFILYVEQGLLGLPELRQRHDALR